MKDQTTIDAREADKILDGNSRTVRDSATAGLGSQVHAPQKRMSVAGRIMYCKPMSVT
jgi:hypothetical protein